MSLDTPGFFFTATETGLRGKFGEEYLSMHEDVDSPNQEWATSVVERLNLKFLLSI